MAAVNFADIQDAAARLKGVAHRTPVMTSHTLDEQVGAEEEVYEGLRQNVSELASASYQSNDPDSVAVALYVDNPSQIFEQSADLNYLSETRRKQLEDFAESDERLIALKEEAETAYDQAEERRRSTIMGGIQQPGPGPAPLGPRAAPQAARRF